jgi:hypothetical protein
MRDWECIDKNWHATLQGCTEFMNLKRSSMKIFLVNMSLGKESFWSMNQSSFHIQWCLSYFGRYSFISLIYY